jgi:hypothetical protein
MHSMPLPLRCLSSVGLCLALAACDSPTTVVDQHFGLAVQRAQAQQSTVRPARQHAAPQHDTDGASSLAAVTRYQQSFQTPPAPTPIFNIGLGAVSAP